MKILILNPRIDAEHKIVRSLKDNRVAVLFASDPAEAWKLLQLHGTSVELAVIHREGNKKGAEPGLEFVDKFKRDPVQNDLPYILTSEAWSDIDFAKHQLGPIGANGYLQLNHLESQLLAMIEAIIGRKIGEATSPSISAASTSPNMSQNTSADFEKQGGMVLEDPTSIYIASENPNGTSIKLEKPQSTGEISLPTATRVEKPASPPQNIPKAPPASIKDLSALITNEAAPALELPTGFTASKEIHAGPAEVRTDVSLQDLQATRIEVRGISAEDASIPPLEVLEESTAASRTLEELAEDRLVADPVIQSEMPYLFNKTAAHAPSPSQPPAQVVLSSAFAQPLGDAVVPGGAAQAPDVDTLKQYLLLREQDVAALSAQLQSAKDQIKALDELLKVERARGVELAHTCEEQKRKLDDFEKAKQNLSDGLHGEIGELKFQLKSKIDRARLLEVQVKDAAEEMERLKERVRADIRKIRVREKELENRLEILKRDSEALIGARENKIVDLKRKIDTLEFNMDLLQDQYTREKETSQRLRERLNKAAQAVRVAGGLLDSQNSNSEAAKAAQEESLAESDRAFKKREAS